MEFDKELRKLINGVKSDSYDAGYMQAVIDFKRCLDATKKTPEEIYNVLIKKDARPYFKYLQK